MILSHLVAQSLTDCLATMKQILVTVICLRNLRSYKSQPTFVAPSYDSAIWGCVQPPSSTNWMLQKYIKAIHDIAELKLDLEATENSISLVTLVTG